MDFSAIEFCIGVCEVAPASIEVENFLIHDGRITTFRASRCRSSTAVVRNEAVLRRVIKYSEAMSLEPRRPRRTGFPPGRGMTP